MDASLLCPVMSIMWTNVRRASADDEDEHGSDEDDEDMHQHVEIRTDLHLRSAQELCSSPSQIWSPNRQCSSFQMEREELRPCG